MCVRVQAMYVGVMVRKASSLMSPLLPLCFLLFRERNPWVCRSTSDCSVCLMDAFPVVCGFEGLCRESHGSCSHHFGQFSWINCDLLTRKCKQVDWSESGHENIYCCRWNVKNAAVLNMKKECRHDISVSFQHLLFMSHLKTNSDSLCMY